MLNRLMSNLVSSFKGEGSKSRSNQIVEIPHFTYIVSLYNISGTNVELLIPKGTLSKEEGKISLKLDDQLQFEWPLERIISLRQYRTRSAQFQFNQSKDTITEYGLHFQSGKDAHTFVGEILQDFLGSATQLVAATTTMHLYNNETRSFEKWMPDCEIWVHQRSEGGMALLSVHELPPSIEALTAIIELGPESQVWCSSEEYQFTVWGTAWMANESGASESQNPMGEEVRKVLLQFSLTNHSASTTEELFLILNKLSHEEQPKDSSDSTNFNATDASTEHSRDIEKTLNKENASQHQENRVDEADNKTSQSIFDDSVNKNGISMKKYEEKEFSKLEFASSDSDSDKDVSYSSTLFSSSVTENSDLDELDNSELQDLQDYSTKYSHYRKPGRVSISMDPSYSIIEKDSNAKLHRFMQVGQDKSFVCRSTDLDDGSGIHWKTSSTDKATDFELVVYGKKSHSHSHIQQDTAISGSKFQYKNCHLLPTKGLLHNSETKLILTDKKDPNSLYYMDLERETVVQRFETESNSPHILWNTFKGASVTTDPTFLCATNQSFSLMDTRAGPCQATKHKLNYVTNPQFSAGASDSHGHFVVANRSGQLRLYDGQPNASGKLKIAKTQLDCVYREPIKAVDTTSDGAWVLGTMRTCLVLFPTRLKSTGTTGFVTRLGQDKPPGLYLRLKKEDIVKYQLEDIDFQPAVFDSINNKILSSTGNLSIMWDFKSIKKGNLTDYKLKILPHYIKDSKTLIDGSVVVAFPTDLGVVSRKRLGVDNKRN